MGSWGEGALENDLSTDAYGDFLDRFDEGSDPKKLPQQLAEAYQEFLLEPDGALDFWIGVAQAQWECGALTSVVADEVRHRIAANMGLKGFRAESRPRRYAALTAFVEQICVPPAKRRRRKNHSQPLAIFQPGDCIAAATLRGGYAPAIVLKVESHMRETYHLIASLRGVHATLPPIEIYERRDWLFLTHGKWKNTLNIGWYASSTYSDNTQDLSIVKVGTTLLRNADPSADINTPGTSYPSWGWIENQAWLQDQWDRHALTQAHT